MELKAQLGNGFSHTFMTYSTWYG